MKVPRVANHAEVFHVEHSGVLWMFHVEHFCGKMCLSPL